MKVKSAWNLPDSRRGVLQIASAMFLWSSLGVAIRLTDADVHLIIFYSNALSLIFFTPMVFATSRKRNIPSGIKLAGLFALGPITLLNTFAFFSAFRLTTISNALMTHYIAPVIVAVLAAIFLGERFTRRVFAAIVVSSIGLWVLLGMSPAELMGAIGAPSDNEVGLALGLLSGVAYALLLVLVRILSPRMDAMIIVFFQNLSMCIILLPFIRGVSLDAVWGIVIIGILHSTLAPLLYVMGLGKIRANKAAILGYLEPVSAIIFALIFLGEVPATVSLFGGLLILLGGYISIKGGSKSSS